VKERGSFFGKMVKRAFTKFGAQVLEGLKTGIKTTKGGINKARKESWKADGKMNDALTEAAGAVEKQFHIKDDRYPGEMHGIIKLPSGKFAYGQYMGPNTAVKQRLQRGDKGRTVIDRLSRIHDMEYILATKQEQILAADKKFIAGVEMAVKQGKDNQFNASQARLMVPKHAFEKITGATLSPETLKKPGSKTKKRITRELQRDSTFQKLVHNNRR
jgi:hypothetical protein